MTLTSQEFNSLMAWGMKLSLSLVVRMMGWTGCYGTVCWTAAARTVCGCCDWCLWWNLAGLLPTLLGVEVLHGWHLHPGDVLSSFHHPPTHAASRDTPTTEGEEPLPNSKVQPSESNEYKYLYVATFSSRSISYKYNIYMYVYICVCVCVYIKTCTF